MPSKNYWEKFISLETPATYRIRVKGRLDETWSDRLAGMDIRSESQENKGSITVLVGPLRDQAELVGVLNNLYELHMPLLTVEVLKSAEGDGKQRVVETFDLQNEKKDELSRE